MGTIAVTGATYPSDVYSRAIFMGHVKHSGRKDKPYLKFTKVQQPGQLERAPASKLNPRTEEVEGEGGRHGTEELKDG